MAVTKVNKKVNKKKYSRTKGRNIDSAVLRVKFSRNNTIVNLSDANGNTLCIASGGTGNKFKNSRKGSPMAGVEAVRMVLRKSVEMQIYLIYVETKGFSIARDEVMQEISYMHSVNYKAEGKLCIQNLKDKTPIKHGGTKAPKARRL